MEQTVDDGVPMPEAAMRLRLSWHQTWRLALTGQLQAVKEGGAWSVSAASIDAYLAKRPNAPQAA